MRLARIGVAFAVGGLLVADAVAAARDGSLRGRVVRRDGAPPTGPCRVELRVAAPRARGARGVRGAFSGALSASGLFAIAPAPPGLHQLRVECPGARASREVLVRPGAASLLDEPLVLEDLLALDLRLEPPLDPTGRSWRLRIDEPAGTATGEDLSFAVSADGGVVVPGMRAGDVSIDVLDADGGRWLRKTLWLGTDRGLVRLSVPSVPVSGRLLLPDRPVRARLLFSDPTGAVLVPFESDARGLFAGRLPALRRANAEGWTVEVRAAAPPLDVDQRLEHVLPVTRPGEGDWFDLALPPVGLHGVVTLEDGRPAERVQVTATPSFSSGTSASTITDAEGRFELHGLADGPHRVAAEAAGFVCDPVDVEITADAPVEAQIVLQTSLRLAGQVLSGNEPVPGAFVRTWLPPGTPRDELRTETDGSFAAKLPPEVGELGLSVGVPGLALRMMRSGVGEGLEIPLEDASGVLVIHTAAGVPGGTTALLVHGGSVESLDFLGSWGAMNGGGVQPTQLVVPRLEPGEYALCVVSAEELAAAWATAALPGRCSAGTLAAGERLDLSLAGL